MKGFEFFWIIMMAGRMRWKRMRMRRRLDMALARIGAAVTRRTRGPAGSLGKSLKVGNVTTVCNRP